MNKIKFMLEYQCSPIWVENEKGELIGNGLPSDLEDNYELVDLLDEIRKIFDGLYGINGIHFRYHGFTSESEKLAFFKKVTKAVDLLKHKAGNIYAIQVNVNEENY